MSIAAKLIMSYLFMGVYFHLLFSIHDNEWLWVGRIIRFMFIWPVALAILIFYKE